MKKTVTLKSRKFFCETCKRHAVLQKIEQQCFLCDYKKVIENVPDMEPEFTEVLEKNGFLVVEGEWNRHYAIVCKQGNHPHVDVLNFFIKKDKATVEFSEKFKENAARK